MWTGDEGGAGPLSARAFKGALRDLARCLRFYSRLPVPVLPWEDEPHARPDLDRMTVVLPAAGLLIGVVPALCLVVSLRLGFGPWLSAALAIAAMSLTTGAFHEDGLADTADGFGGGADPPRRLAIMKDSLIGSFGASALILAYALRIGALATLAERLPLSGAVATLLVAAMLSRISALVPVVFLPAARPDGVSQAAGRPSAESFWKAAGLAGILSLALGFLGGLPIAGIALMCAFAGLVGYGMTRLCGRLIGGQTGDVAGATQQVAEIAAMLGLLIQVEP